MTEAAHQPPESFLSLLEELQLQLEVDEIAKLGQFLSHLLDVNQRFNLTSITDPVEAWTRHVFDSLTLVPFITGVEAKSVIDVGSGGGVPGIPIAITMPELQFTLVESTGKKARFLEQAVALLELTNVEVLNDRAETLGANREMRERYDAVIARAVGPLSVLLELTAPFARVGGMILAIKGERAPAEIEGASKALDVLRCRIAGVERSPTGTIVAIEKLAKTPRIYPRRPGEPKRAPL